jgi:hypothetical protein
VPLPAPPVEALPAPEPVTAVQPAYQDEPDGGVHAQIFGVAPPRTSGRRDRTGGPAPYEQQPDGDDPRFGDARFDDPLFDDPRFDAPRFDDPLFDDARFDGRPPDERPYEGQRQDDPRLDVPRRPDSRREARRDPRRPAWDSQDLPPAEPPAPRR